MARISALPNRSPQNSTPQWTGGPHRTCCAFLICHVARPGIMVASCICFTPCDVLAHRSDSNAFCGTSSRWSSQLLFWQAAERCRRTRSPRITHHDGPTILQSSKPRRRPSRLRRTPCSLWAARASGFGRTLQAISPTYRSESWFRWFATGRRVQLCRPDHPPLSAEASRDLRGSKRHSRGEESAGGLR